VISSLAAALIARLRSLPVTFFAALVVGLVTAMTTPWTPVSEYRQMAPFVLAVIALLWLSRKRTVTIPGTSG
jgi:branched-chain amino acid transport system permease protein